MTSNPYLVPAPIGKVLSLLPSFPRSFAFVSALNIVLLKQFPADVIEALNNKTLRIHVKDAQLSFDFKCVNGRFVVASDVGKPDLCITASAYDFYLLAQQKVDPDTLFFSQRLSMEGDTELGVLVKNTLDAISLPKFGLDDLKPAAVWSRFTMLFRHSGR